jgi:ketosteroid isomerase-like protein
MFAAITENDHTALRELIHTASDALSIGDLDKMQSLLDEDFTLVTMDNNKVSSFADFKSLWEKTFAGEQAIISKIEIEPTVESETRFLSDDVGFSDGIATEKYYFIDGKVKSLETRWTAVLHKVDGQWKFAQLHFSANVFDNPVLNSLKAKIKN